MALDNRVGRHIDIVYADATQQGNLLLQGWDEQGVLVLIEPDRKFCRFIPWHAIGVIGWRDGSD